MISLIIIAVISLSVLILIHELGHYLAARLSGVWVEEFGIGLPPRIWGVKIGSTIYSLNALPIGGFVRLHGESGEDRVTKPKKAFVNKSKLARIFISIAGILMNFLFAIICFSIIYCYTGIPRGVQITDVSVTSPAEVAGLKKGDTIVEFNGKKNLDYEYFPDLIAKNKGKAVMLKVESQTDGITKTKDVELVIRSESPEGEGLLGVQFIPEEIYYPPIIKRPFVYTKYGVQKAVYVSEKTIAGFEFIFSELFKGQKPKGVAGPLGVTVFIAEVASIGLLPLIEFVGIISINLALVNLIPFPPLDGGRVLLISIEAALGKKILPKIESSIHIAGMVVLLFLMLLVTAGEIPKLLSANSLSEFVDSLIE